ncbi:hypothetical protein ABIC60_003441 [Phyllobacterium ifriqiyense]
MHLLRRLPHLLRIARRTLRYACVPVQLYGTVWWLVIIVNETQRRKE